MRNWLQKESGNSGTPSPNQIHMMDASDSTSDVEISHSVDATDIPFGYLSDLSSDGSDFDDVDARLAADDLAHLASQRMFDEPRAPLLKRRKLVIPILAQ